MTFPDVPLGIRLEVAPGADVIADEPVDWPWLDVTSSWHVPAGIRVDDGRSEGAVQAEPSDLKFKLKNDDGQWTPDDPRSIHWPGWAEGCPARVSVNPGTGWVVLPGSSTFLDEILPTWTSGSSRQALVSVAAKGLLDILGRGQDPPRTAPYLTIVAGEPVAYWPLDDGRDADFGRSAVGGPTMIIGHDAAPASVDLAPWLTPVVGAGSSGQLGLQGSLTMPNTGTWWVDFACRLGASALCVTEGIGTGPGLDGQPRVDWALELNGLMAGGTIQLVRRVREATTSSVTVIASIPAPDLFDEQLHACRFRVSQVGADVTWAIDVDGVQLDDGTIAASTLWQTLRYAQVLVAGPTDQPTGYGHLAIWAATPPDVAAAVHGYPAEPAAERISRVCGETGIRVTVTGDAASTEPMGPQYPGQPLDILRACEAADRGVLGELEFGLHYLTRSARYNRATALTIDAGQRQLHKDFAPRRDLQRVRNEWTVSRRNGSQATARDLVHQARRGRLSDSVELDVATDARLAHQASWRVLEGTTPGLRHPELVIRLDTTPALVGPWLALMLGDWVAAVNLMPQYPPDGLLQLVEGRSQMIAGRRGPWHATMRVSPAAPWRVFVLDDPVLGRLETGGSALAAPFVAGTDTSMSVTVTGAALWSTAAGDVPFDITVAGVRLTVVAVAGASSPQTFTVIATPVNGVTKTIPAGTPIKTHGLGVLAL